MSYLSLAKGAPNFSKAVISLWFRVPQAAIDKAAAASTGQKLLDGIVPLVVMGKKGSGNVPFTKSTAKAVEYNINTYEAVGLGNVYFEEILVESPPIDQLVQATRIYNPNAFIVPATSVSYGTVETLVTGTAPQKAPTYIGVNERGTLQINFETAQVPAVTNNTLIRGSITPGTVHGHGPSPYQGPAPSPPGPHDAYPTGTVVWQFNPWFPGTFHVVSDTSQWVEWPVREAQITQPVYNMTDRSRDVDTDTGSIYSDTINVRPDQWHHVLISVDLRDVSTHGSKDLNSSIADNTDSAARLFVAFDDANRTGANLSSRWVEGGSEPNAVITDSAYKIAAAVSVPEERVPPTYSLSGAAVPASDTPIGMPATPEFVDDVYRVEMAEFQMWVGVTLDTGVAANRRAFIDYLRDEKGNVILDKNGIATLKPVDPKKAEKLLGKRPDILLHGSGRWIKGKNTGSSGIASNGTEIPSGQFQPVARIKKYTPDPSIKV